MHFHIAGTPAHRPRHGFTLVELMIALVVVAVLTMVALPFFQDAIHKSRRSDAIVAISAVQQAQERKRSNWPQYCASITSVASDSPRCGLDFPTDASPNRHYTLALTDTPTATDYEVVATAVGGQASDTACLKMAARVQGGSLSYGSGTSSIDYSDPGRCWAK